MRCALYARVSSAEQVENYSIDAQLGAARAFALSRCWPVVAEYVDKGISAKTDQRPEFRRMLADAESKVFDVIVVHKLDRFSRSIIDVLTYLRLLSDRGVAFVSVTEQFDFTTPIGKVLLALLAAFSQWYLDNLSQETRKGMLQAARVGDWPCGVSSLGYKRVDGRVVPSADAEMIRVAFHEFASGRYSLSEFSQWAYDQGYRNRVGKRMGKSRWSSIFRNVFYTGVVSWGGVVAEGNHPPIVDRLTFDLVQEVLRSHDRHVRRLVYRSYLLSGFVWSLDAGCPMTGGSGKGYLYYRSTNPVRGGFRHHVLASELEGQVADVLRSVCLTGEPPGSLCDTVIFGLCSAVSVGHVYELLQDSVSRRQLLSAVVAPYGLRVHCKEIVDVALLPVFSSTDLRLRGEDSNLQPTG